MSAPNVPVASPEHAVYPSLAGRKVIITGGGSGIGAALVEAFVAQQAQVFFLDIAAEASQALVQSLQHAAVPPRFFQCNLMDLEQLRATFAAIEAVAGSIDVLINNAANDDRHKSEDVSPAYWDERIAVNLRHQFFCAQAVMGGMRRQQRGVILNFGSISWRLGLPDLTLYMTAKAGIEGMTRGLARDLGRDGIRVNAIIPGAIRTPRQTLLWHTPEEEAKILAAQCLPARVETHHVAALALFLASDSAAMCSGRDYHVDGGWLGA